jgi:hypothetical protein
MAYVVIALCFAFSGGIVGRLKGSSFVLWFLISGLVPVLGLLAAVAYRSESEELQRLCPRCGRVIKLYDAVCTRCGLDLEFPSEEELVAPEAAQRRVSGL